jgi:hypothetical protein
MPYFEQTKTNDMKVKMEILEVESSLEIDKARLIQQYVKFIMALDSLSVQAELSFMHDRDDIIDLLNAIKRHKNEKF